MLDLFLQGGPLFMGLLTLILFSLLATFIIQILKKGDEKQLAQAIQWMKSIGTLGLVLGIFGQLIGLYSAFSVIESAGGISPAILAGGLKVSLITSIYGILIYIIYLILSMVLRRVW